MGARGSISIKQKKEEKIKTLNDFLKILEEEHSFFNSTLEKKVYEKERYNGNGVKLSSLLKQTNDLRRYDLDGLNCLKEDLINIVMNEFDYRKEDDYRTIWEKIIEAENDKILEEIKKKQKYIKGNSIKRGNQGRAMSIERETQNDVVVNQQSQLQVQTNKKVAVQSMSLDFYLVETFKNVIKAFKIYESTDPRSKDKEANKIALDIAIDNSFVQFKQCRSEYPSSNKDALQSYMESFEKEFNKFVPDLKSRDIKPQIDKFKKIIQGEEVTMTRYEPVNNIDPKDVLALNYAVQKSYNKTDKTLDEISKKSNYEKRPINSQSHIYGRGGGGGVYYGGYYAQH